LANCSRCPPFLKKVDLTLKKCWFNFNFDVTFKILLTTFFQLNSFYRFSGRKKRKNINRWRTELATLEGVECKRADKKILLQELDLCPKISNSKVSYLQRSHSWTTTDPRNKSISHLRANKQKHGTRK
jgi:hypothetical protein